MESSFPTPVTVDIPVPRGSALRALLRKPFRILTAGLWIAALGFLVIQLVVIPSPGNVYLAVEPAFLVLCVTIMGQPLLGFGKWGPPPTTFSVNAQGVEFRYPDGSAKREGWDSPTFKLEVRDLVWHRWKGVVPGPEPHWFFAVPPSGRPFVIPPELFAAILSESGRRGLAVSTRDSIKPDVIGVQRIRKSFVIRARHG